MKSLQKLFSGLRNPTKRKKALLVVSGSLIISGWTVNYLWGSTVLFNTLMIASAMVAGMEIVRRAWQGLKNRHTNIELLVTIAAAGGLVIEVYWEAAAVTFLFLLGGWLEARTMSKTRKTLRELINMAPDTALVLDDGSRREIPAREVREGMLVLVKPGSKIPVDGIVDSGSTAVDESAITGEPIPAEKQSGSEVFAGSLNKNGSILVQTTKAGSDTTLARIIRRVEEAQEEKAPTQRFIERFARWYTPAIVALSIISYLVTQNLELALTLLVIGCPGALVISTPISIISGIGNAAKKGILIKGGEYLENAGKLSAIALDKTGTLTEGQPKVTEFVYFQREKIGMGVDKPTQSNKEASVVSVADLREQYRPEEIDELLYWAGIAEMASEHPLADAILDELPSLSVIPEADNFTSHTGLGIEASYDRKRILAGNLKFLDQQGIFIGETVGKQVTKLAGKGRTTVLVAVDDTFVGGMGLADPVRPDARAMIARLREDGINRIVMLTGDALPVAQAISKEVGIGEVHAGILPDQKNDIIQNMQQEGEKVAMIGDGINDAPALATADIGIAMGAAGTDVAIETADIALMSDKLMNIPEALRISKQTLRNIHQNVAMALLTVGALLTGVFMGSVHMAAGMLIHELSVMLVILNGMRLRWL
ncbi:cation-translocating P-type ATPase [Balneolaceae bacterium YR4-1]|uniref:P-type Zn(2+) transporter n=1 Tax=Halalkalibaculum roseum TaxID=2709311 RepID=A0A6M1SQN7_9BACT|nr:cation-translocating P-type ATPase [Halalkalibaculum roseum]NGP75120.1 cation-translocating P-type ATPase [Halalkalibaculum roseum]